MDINITMLNGTSFTLRVNPDDTVGSLKRLIQSKQGIRPHNQNLVFKNGHSTALSDDSKSVRDYGLWSGCQVYLMVTEPAPFQVFLKNEKGQTSTYNTKPDETVRSFKGKVHSREGVPVDQQRLIFQGKEMMDGTLADYGVEALGTIYMTLRLRGG